MSRAQRLSFLAVAVAIAVVAALLLSRGGADDGAATGARTTPAPTATPTATAIAGEATPSPSPTATPRPQPPLIGPGKVTRLRFEEGQTVRFRVRAAAPDEIHVHGYEVTEAVGTEPTPISFRADITGIFEIELHGTGEQIAQLRVDPRLRRDRPGRARARPAGRVASPSCPSPRPAP